MQRRVAELSERCGGPLPNVADQLVDAAHAGASGKLVDGDGAVIAGAMEVSASDVERLTPRVAPLCDATRSGFDRPAAGLGPFGVGGQAFADPARVRPGFKPTDPDDGQTTVAALILAVLPIARPRYA